MDARTSNSPPSSADVPDDDSPDVIERDEWNSLFHDGKSAPAAEPESPQRFVLRDFSQIDSEQPQSTRFVSLELGRAQVDADTLQPGHVVGLDRRESDPVDVRCNGRIVARGELIILRGKLCLRIVELLPMERPS